MRALACHMARGGGHPGCSLYYNIPVVILPSALSVAPKPVSQRRWVTPSAVTGRHRDRPRPSAAAGAWLHSKRRHLS